MGKYIVLKVDSDVLAQDILNEPPYQAEVIGVFMMPTKFCTCTDILSRDGIIKPGQFIRGTRFGLYVHKTCKMPRAGHTHYMKNLLLDTKLRERYGMAVTMVHPYTSYIPFNRSE